VFAPNSVSAGVLLAKLTIEFGSWRDLFGSTFHYSLRIHCHAVTGIDKFESFSFNLRFEFDS